LLVALAFERRIRSGASTDYSHYIDFTTLCRRDQTLRDPVPEIGRGPVSICTMRRGISLSSGLIPIPAPLFFEKPITIRAVPGCTTGGIRPRAAPRSRGMSRCFVLFHGEARCGRKPVDVPPRADGPAVIARRWARKPRSACVATAGTDYAAGECGKPDRHERWTIPKRGRDENRHRMVSPGSTRRRPDSVLGAGVRSVDRAGRLPHASARRVPGQRVSLGR